MTANTAEVENAEEAAKRALSVSSDLFAKAGYDRLNPFTDSMDAQVFTDNLQAEFDDRLFAFRGMSDSSLEARGAAEVVKEDREAIAGWEWATESLEQFEAFKEAAGSAIDGYEAMTA